MDISQKRPVEQDNRRVSVKKLKGVRRKGKRQGARSLSVPADLIQLLEIEFPEFEELEFDTQLVITSYILYSRSHARAHKNRKHKDCFWLHYQELDEDLGRGAFKAINAKLGFFRFTANWSVENG